MIKNIIFDVDNTIFDSSESNAIYYREAFQKINCDDNRYIDLYHSLESYEDNFNENNNKYVKEDLINVINKVMKEHYPTKLIDEMNDVVGKYIR